MNHSGPIPAPARRFYKRFRGRLLPALLLAILLAFIQSEALAPPGFAATEREVAPGAKVETAVAGRSLAGSYLSGRFARGQGDVGRASEYAAQALARDPENPALLTHAFRLHLSGGRMKEAIALAHRLQAKNTRDPAVDLVLAIEQIRKKDYVAASRILDVEEASGFSAVMIPLISTWLDVAQGKITEAVTLKGVTDGAGSFAPLVHYHLALINDVAGFPDTAEKYYQLAAKGARRMPYRVAEAFANFYLRAGKPEKAKAIAETYRKANPESILGGEGTFAPALSKGKQEKPAPLVDSAEEGIAEIFFSVASLLFNEDAPADTMAYAQLALALRPDFPSTQLMLGSLYEQSGDFARAAAAYNAIASNSPLAGKAKLRVALNLDRMGQTALALRQIDSVARAYPKDHDPWLIKGDLLRGRERYQEAAAAYGEAIARLGPPQKWHWPIFFARGIAYERANQWPKAETDLKKALQLEPNQPDVLNYLGYSWLIMGKRIEEAKKMIEQAIELRPADPQIIDSMGWALYALGDYDEALDYLERAVELLPGDATVNDHLGDVYWRMGRKTEARFQWERALIFEKNPKQAADIRKKVTDGLPAEKAPTKTAESKNKAGAPARSGE